jgi:serine-type D-Ala-D-Ala carboxypeptidase/endopeptidase (penicillin-binding protein 4)
MRSVVAALALACCAEPLPLRSPGALRVAPLAALAAPASEDPWEPPPPLAPLDAEGIAPEIDAALNGVRGALHSALVVRAATGEVIYAREPDRLLKPASLAKLFTTAAALVALGEEHRSETVVLSSHAPVDGDAGDVVLAGDHDFGWSSRWHASARVPLERLAAAVAANGVTRVGAVVVHGEVLFEGETLGTYDAERERREVAQAFAAALRDAGVAVAGTRAGSEAPVFELARSRSPTLLRALPQILGESHNELADLLLRHLAHPSSYAAGVAEAARVLALPLALVDGSGLSHENRASARQLVEVMQAMRLRPEGEAWLAAFSVAGERGTLAKRLGGPTTRGRFRGKTGTLSDTVGLAGELVHAQTREAFLVALLANGMSDPAAARAAHDKVIEALARDRGSVPDAARLLHVAPEGALFRAVWTPADALVWRSRDGKVWPRSEARLYRGTSALLAGFDGVLHLRVNETTLVARHGTPQIILLGDAPLGRYAAALVDRGVASCIEEAGCPLDGAAATIWAGTQPARTYTLMFPPPDTRVVLEPPLPEGYALDALDGAAERRAFLLAALGLP